MGSFANGIQVWSTETQPVADAVDAFMRAESYEATDEAPAEDVLAAFSSPLRAIQLTESRDGWVGVLDSDMMHGAQLAAELSSQLQTYVLHTMTHDSDAWMYLLFHRGEMIDQFDSSGGDEGMFGEDEEDMDLEALGIDGLTELAGVSPVDVASLEQQVRDVQNAMEAEMPAEIRKVQNQLQSGEQPTPDQLQQYSEWMREQAQQMVAGLEGLGVAPFLGATPVDAGETPAGDASRVEQSSDDESSDDGQDEADAEAAADHIQQLRPIIPPGAESRVAATFSRQAIFAEEVLGDFFAALAIPPSFANLSYQYLQEWSPGDLANANINLASHLKYVRRSA